MKEYTKKLFSTLKFLFRKDSVHLVTQSASGTHWLVQMLGSAISYKKTSSVDVNEIMPHLFSENEMPIRQSHSNYFPFAGKAKTVFLVRDIRDSVVSHYESYIKNRNSNLPFKAFLRESRLSKKYGLSRRVNLLNSWFKSKERCDDFMLVRYEDLKEDTEKELIRIFKFVGLDTSLVSEAVQTSSLKKMKEMDDRRGKVNKGVVGRYKEYFSKEDEEYLRNYLEDNLIYDYGYKY